ncbi:putative PIN and TRAM-domain containing protein YacL [Paenibacillus nasutitermitis]|uniref:PIN and TRAM-domain containing protein YacL n=2 Tax=Paenibacillus nasutitermitis TaxID=1652958 RepID=A0A916ZJQ6_9BACL|nr:PIN/TRAM domain-containing protein [Paenibacillus nasutitermitis]GGE01263.1 putative PIN and TRAM-domain containing protein YacL [Paenibacillus nasutitermitis]
MMKRMVQLFGICFGGVMGAELHSWTTMGTLWMESSSAMQSGSYYMNVGIGALCGLVLASMLAAPLIRWIQSGTDRISSLPTGDLLAGVLGLILGLVLSALLYPAVSGLTGAGEFIPIAIMLITGYAGMRIGFSKREELSEHISLLMERGKGSRGEDDSSYEEHKILDTSVIIDGRIADICKTGFIEGTLVIPEFVLEELQHIADSSDLLKRNRGRRGLDILNKIQKELDVRVLIYEGDMEEGEVDSKLVKLAKVLHGKVVTNDFNLNKVCELQGVSVLNINDLANAVKPVVLPGEEIVVQVIKDGKEHGQGVAYLDDGTMIVVEGGRDYIGSTMEVLVTSVLQTSAGRMIFAKPKLLEKAL